MTLDKPWLNASLAVDARVALLLAVGTVPHVLALGPRQWLRVDRGWRVTRFAIICEAEALGRAPYIACA